MDAKPTYQELENKIAELSQRDDEKFKQLVKNSFDMIVLLNAKGVQHYVSESCERILGYKPEELIGISVIEKMIHPEDQQDTITGLYDIIENGTHGGVMLMHKPWMQSAIPTAAEGPGGKLLPEGDVAWNHFRIKGLHIIVAFIYFRMRHRTCREESVPHPTTRRTSWRWP